MEIRTIKDAKTKHMALETRLQLLFKAADISKRAAGRSLSEFERRYIEALLKAHERRCA